MKYLIKNNILAQQHYIPIFINLSNNDQNKIIKNYFK